jgi:hypothetical protein
MMIPDLVFNSASAGFTTTLSARGWILNLVVAIAIWFNDFKLFAQYPHEVCQ